MSPLLFSFILATFLAVTVPMALRAAILVAFGRKHGALVS
jgi:hypothetical protein